MNDLNKLALSFVDSLKPEEAGSVIQIERFQDYILATFENRAFVGLYGIRPFQAFLALTQSSIPSI